MILNTIEWIYNLKLKNMKMTILFSTRDLTITFIYNKMNISKQIMILILIYSNNAINIIIILLKFYM